ncbi:MAG: hypothetical protein GTO53_07130, partial [Planctomycetales bacterium]|nr:hypothetical protein [Planctomycetales bacterium]NIM08909.1 hypothetical protein [Planctomycetales bacterium]NIN08365.1 hypothetical protein [Planctomycetales bacterium]NIN77493.1 hypothetical protein [Planctomycetales bacterium]NIO34665.1 hypothetical protein [Planctomycetales bacterium]
MPEVSSNPQRPKGDLAGPGCTPAVAGGADPRARQTLFRTAVACSLALCAVLAWPIVAGHVYVADDLGQFHLPARAFYAHCLAAGHDFDWWPQLYG